MFERILIKSGSNQAERFLSIADLVDMMFYYGEVHVVVSQFELKQLLDVFGEDVLYELIESNRLYIHPCDQHVGAVRQGGFESVGLFSTNFSSIEELLSNFHREVSDNESENERFAKRFAEKLDIFRYSSDVQDSLYRDVEDEDLLSRATQVFVKQYYPDYQGADDIRVKADSSGISFMSFYRIEGNLRFDELNSLHHRYGYNGSLAYSTVLMSLGETHVDCYLASELQAELIANQRWSEIYKLRMNECIRRAEGSHDNIDHFREMTANDYLSPGQSFANGLISSDELLKDLNCSDSQKFREWLYSIPEGQPITGEIYKSIQSQNSNKAWVKIARGLSQVVTGVLNPILGGAHTLLDGLVGDRLINGWKPSLFVSRVLNNDIYRIQ